MRRVSAILGSVVFLLLAPGVVAGYLPWLISRWHMQPAFWHLQLWRTFGIILIAAGLPMLLDSFARFALQGLGTPAPVFPTKHLVVTGLYRFVRNPMYVGVLWVIVGQGLFFGDLRLLEYAAAVWLAFYVFVLVYEEPTLRRTYGNEYEVFLKGVPRWIPRLTPWTGSRTTANKK